ncbi:MAG: patatin family protein [Spirochaetes bacterium]|nr:patatin family protein [Spirochaetota bacterium]
MRGIFAAGVLDAFHEADFDPFSIYYGVSAGACNLSSHLARQYRRNYRIFTDQMVRPGFISKKNYLRGGHLLDLDWLWKTLEKEDPLDTSAVIRNLKRKKREFVIVATSIESGAPLYLTPDETNLWHLLKVSSSIPVLYRNFLRVNSGHATDGGIADPIPVVEAYRRGARTIFVIRSRVAEYVKKRGLEATLSSFYLRKYRALSDAVRRQAVIYREAVEFINAPPRDARIIHIAPTEPLLTTRTGQVRDHLERDYARGVETGRTAMATMREIHNL